MVALLLTPWRTVLETLCVSGSLHPNHDVVCYTLPPTTAGTEINKNTLTLFSRKKKNILP